MSTPAVAPAEVTNCPLSTYSTPGSRRTAGNRARNAAAAAQCVVARRPSSRPVAARVNVPTQIEARRVPAAAAARNASSAAAGAGVSGS